MIRRAVHFAILLVVLATPDLLACGHCKEDKVAATYDAAALQRARARRHLPVFLDVRGSQRPDVENLLTRAARAVPGVDRDSVRVSAWPTAAFFSVDPRKVTPAAAIRAFNSRLRPHGLVAHPLPAPP